MEATYEQRKCTECKQWISDITLYNGNTSRSVSEQEALRCEIFSAYKDNGLIGNKAVHTLKLTSFNIYDKNDHLCPFHTGLIEEGVNLYFSGFIKTLDDENATTDTGIPVYRVGPITEWWIYGFDGEKKTIIGLTTKFALYYLMEPSDLFEPIFNNIHQKSELSKRVIEFLLDYGWQNPSFEDLIQHLKNFPTFTEVEELLICEAKFLINQVISYDEDTSDDEIPMISFACMQSLINLAGINLKKQILKNTSSKIRKNYSKIFKPTVRTNLVKRIFKSIFCNQFEDENTKNTNSSNFSQACTLSDFDKSGNLENPKSNPSQFNECKNSEEQRCDSLADITIEDEEIGEKPVHHKECSKQILHPVKWLKKCVINYNGCQGYSSANVDNFVIQQGDYVVLNAEDSEEPLRVAKVSYMYDSPQEGGSMFHAHFFCRGVDTILGNTADPNELFLVDDCDNYPLGCVVRKVEVEFKHISKIWVNSSKNGDFMNSEEREDKYFFSKIYDYEYSRFREYTEDNMDQGNPCLSCKWQTDLKNYNTPIWRDNFILWREDIFKIGTNVFLEPGQKENHVSKPSEEERKYPLNSLLYPEIYRKNSDAVRGSNLDTPEPFTVGVIEHIKVQRSDIKIKVRMFYRPEDTIGTVFTSYIKDINFLYWTNHTIWTTFRNVAGKCFVTYSKDEISAREWSDKGPFRFYYLNAYDFKTSTVHEVPLEGQIYCSGFAYNKNTLYRNYELRSLTNEFVNNNNEAPTDWETLTQPLKCMDIYAGCGGLSEGLHQAGAAETLWAVEKEIPPAQTFKLNHPNSHLFVNDCNDILQTLLNGKGKEIGLPDKGDVDLLVGGPPCQGFSGMNRFSTGYYSNLKNSQIVTFLSYCDYYRPKYIILENVRNFVSFKKNIIFKLTLKCLLAMGYQVSFGILQAGNFGLPQTRRRFILFGAAPGYVLPDFPEPLHVFSRSGTFLSIVVDGLRYDTGLKWAESLPYRTICVRDAIADLPEIENGCKRTEMPYDETAKSHFQRFMRKKNRNGLVKDHICKEMSPIVQSRISYIPTHPGADWRDLPNKIVYLRDGSKTNTLKYPYRKKTQAKYEPPKGVCKCATGGSCDPSDRQFNTLIPWFLSHTADRHNNWTAVYGRLEWDGFFGTTITNPEPMGTQGRVIHPEQDRVVSVRECARSQGFQDEYKFCGNILDKHRQVGNAVPPPLALALGREIIKACNKN